MSEMDVTESGNDYSNDLLLLDRVFLRLGNADTDEQLENCLNRFLPPVILKLSSPHEQVRTKVMELLVHVNKRVKCRAEVKLPVQTLLQLYMDPNSNSFIINFSIIYITMGYPRLSRELQIELAPTLLEAIDNKPQGHQDGLLILVIPLLGEIKETNLKLKEKPKLASLIVKFATDILLLPYKALPSQGEPEFQVPPGMSSKSYKRLIDKNPMNANQLEQMKLSIVQFISKDIFTNNDVLLPLIVAAADSRFSVANHANSPLIRANSSVDWSQASVVFPLYSLYLGTWGGSKLPPDERKVPACTRLRLKLIQYLVKATGPAILFPHCVQVVFTSLFDPNTNSRLRNQGLVFLSNVINFGDTVQLDKVSTVFLQGLLKIIRSEEYPEHQPKAYVCLGRLALKCPGGVRSSQFSLLEELIKKIPESPPEIKTAIRDALLDMALAYRTTFSGKESDQPEKSPDDPSTSQDKMDVDESTDAKQKMLDKTQALVLFALLDHYMQNDEPMIRYIAMRYASTVFPPEYIPSRYLLLLASGDSKDEISTEALKCLYGSSRESEIQDVVNNVEKKETKIDLEGESSNENKDISSEGSVIVVPKFKAMINYIWEQIQKRKKGSNAKHRFVVNNQVLQFHPMTYQEILRYLRMCLNRDADLKDCSNHPNATSPLLAKYLYENLLDTELLDRYLTVITSVLNASPDLMSLTCLLDIVGCIPEKIAPKYTNLLPFLRNLFTTNTKEDIRDTAAVIYAIIFVHTSEKPAIDKEINEFVTQGLNNRSLESQCGYLSAFANICERAVALSRKGKFGGKGFSVADWEPYQQAALCLANFLISPQTLLVSASCSAISLLARCSGLPLPNTSPKEDTLLKSDNPFNINTAVDDSNVVITKFTVAQRLFKIVGNMKLPSKIRERALFTLGLMCCGERLSFAKQIVMGFLQMAKDSKEVEIHLQIGESLVLCVQGVNSNENRDLWTELPMEVCLNFQGVAKVKDSEALKENDVLLEWVLEELFRIGKQPHPHSRQATSIWLLALLKNCPDRQPIRNKVQELQNTFMDFLSENSETVQDVASKGLSLVYQNSDEDQKKSLVGQIIEQLTSGKRAVAQVTDDTKIFEEGQLGKAPTGGNLSTYKELCSLASDLNKPDLLYKFMHLAHHNSIWNSKKGAAFGFHSIASQAGAQLSEHLPKIVPRLYRYRFDPTPRIQNSMTSIWHAIVPSTQATVQKFHKEILEDLVANMTSNQWRVRMASCNALTELLRGAKSLHDSLEHLATIWSQLFRVMDDVHEGTRQAASTTANTLSKLCIRACDVSQGKDGKEIVAIILPVLLDSGITNIVKEVRNICLQTVSKLVASAGESLKPFLPKLIPALVGAAGDLESAKLSYLSTKMADSGTREMLDDMRANATKQHYTIDTVVKCMPFITIDLMKEMLPQILELMKSPQLGTKVACCHFIILSAHYLRTDLEPVAGKIMNNLLNGTFDRNVTIRKNYADALGQVSAYAKPQSVEKLMKKLVSLYETKEDDISRSTLALTLKAISKAKLEHIKDNETIVAPMVFLAMHGTEEDAEMYEDVWTDISPSKETGIKQNLPGIRTEIERAFNLSSWTKKIQAANAIKTICKVLTTGLGDQREQFVRSLLAAVHGKTYNGKENVVQALAALCAIKDKDSPLSPTLANECINALLVECRKQDLQYKKHAITALGEALAVIECERFSQVYEIVKVILSKDESSIDKDSDDEDKEGVRKRREQFSELKEAAYELLGKAWPKDYETQAKYQNEFFEHCSSTFPACSRTTQVSILMAMYNVVEKLAVLTDKDEPMETDSDDVTDRDRAISAVIGHVGAVIDYTLTNINQVRHRRDALKIMEVLIKQLKDLKKTEELNKLKTIYQNYSKNLSKDSSHEIRTNADSIKVLLEKSP